MTDALYEVVVGNVGVVYSGDSHREADKTFAEYQIQSFRGRGRAAGEPVTLLINGNIVREHHGGQQEDAAPGE